MCRIEILERLFLNRLHIEANTGHIHVIMMRYTEVGITSDTKLYLELSY